MRTLHLDTEDGWRGGQQQLLYLLEGLLSGGHHATLLAQPGTLILERAHAAGIEVRPFPTHGEADLRAAWRLSRLIRGERFDLVHCHTAHAHGIALAARWSGPARVQPKLVVARRVVFLPRGPRLLKLDRLKYGLVDRIIAVSEAVKAGLIRQGVEASRIAVIRDGIDVARIESAPERFAGVRRSFGVRPGERLIANVAHLGKEKGHEDLVAATRFLRAARPDARVVIIGDGGLRPRLERQARALNLGQAIVFAGFRPPDEVATILKAVDVFVYPSVHEGLGSALLEAMAAGAPIVATRTGGIPEIVDDRCTGLLVPPRDPEALARAVVRLLDDTALARRLAEAARQFVHVEGTKERMVEETIAVYRKVVEA